MMKCPNCESEMEEKGTQERVEEDGEIARVDITWDVCPKCGTTVDDFGNIIPPGHTVVHDLGFEIPQKVQRPKEAD